jgi:aminopeptidase N
MRMRLCTLALVALVVLVNTQSNGYVPPICPSDFNSFANTQQVIAHHYHLDLNVNFTRKSLVGFAKVHLKSKIDSLNRITLDTAGLIIKKINLRIHERDHSITDFVVTSASDIAAQGYPADYGQPLTINIPSHIHILRDQQFHMDVHYETTNASYAIQW